jgi:hypothetical protein
MLIGSLYLSSSIKVPIANPFDYLRVNQKSLLPNLLSESDVSFFALEVILGKGKSVALVVKILRRLNDRLN